MRSLFILISLVQILFCKAGGDDILKGARSAGMGYTGLCTIDPWSLRSNPAGIAGIRRSQAALFHQRHFLSNELTDQGIAVVIPIASGAFGICADHFGHDLYNETRTSFAYAMHFGDGFRAGVQLDHLSIRFGDVYGHRNALIAEAGFQARITEAIWIGAHLYNPGSTSIGGPYDDRIPTLLRAGLMYIFSDRLTTNIEVEKDIDQQECLRIGIEYHPTKVLFLRTGLSSAPMQMHFGFGLRFDRLGIDLAVAAHARLGATPVIGLSYEFK